MINNKSFAARKYSEFEERFDDFVTKLNFKPTIAFAFLSISLPIDDLIKKFNKHNIQLLGASSCGEILFDDSMEIISDDGMVILLTDIKVDSYVNHLFERNELSSIDFGKKIGKYVKKTFKNPSVIITTSGLSLDGQELVEGIISETGNKITMFGGLAGDNSKFEETVTFDKDNITNNGANVLVIDGDKIQVQGLATSGWIGLGAELEITRSTSNIVYEIDNQPALDVYTNYLNVKEEELPAIGIEYPLMLNRKDNVEALRAVLGINKDEKSLIFAGSVPQGSVVTFSSSPGFDVVDNTISALNHFYEEYPKADIFLLFSCMARHLALGPIIAEEISFASKNWDAPVIGFFTYGEIGSNENKSCDFYNQTYSIVQLTEK